MAAAILAICRMAGVRDYTAPWWKSSIVQLQILRQVQLSNVLLEWSHLGSFSGSDADGVWEDMKRS